MKILYSLILLFYGYALFGQGNPSNLPVDRSNEVMTTSPSLNQNYILTTTYLQPYTTTPSQFTAGKASPDIQYFDGLGRPIENVAVKASQNGSDAISMQTYDAFGNPEKAYLSYTKNANNGAFVSNTTYIQDQNSFLTGIYGATDGAAGYTITAYEKSPLNRIINKGAPGADWQLTRPVRTTYKTNSSADQVTNWVYYPTTNSFGIDFNYPDGTLYMTETADEDGKITREYTDNDGRVLQRESDGLKTRYCYDYFGRLLCVLQPSATSPSSNYYETFQYKYDNKGRLIEKKLPILGDPNYYIYDLRDRLVLAQDGYQRGKSPQEWSYTIYDDFNRPLEQGTWTSTTDRTTLTSSIDVNPDYMSGQTSRNTLKKYYYSNYSNFPGGNAFYTSDATSLGVVQAANNKDRLTGENVRLLNSESDMTVWLFKAYYYDKYGRLIQTVADNHLGGKDYITNKYNFAGQVVQTRTRHVVSGVTKVLDQYFDYDHRGRLMKTRQSIDQGTEVLVAANSYNETGNLNIKYLYSVSGGNFLQKNDYTYNIRNWLTGINDPAAFSENDKFGLRLQYNAVTSPGTAQYNGNIAAMLWGTPANPNMRYDFSYDNKNRLINSVFSKTGYVSGALNENMAYDANGNITNMNRYDTGGTAIDNLVMSCTGSLLGSVADNSMYWQQNYVPNYPGKNIVYGIAYYRNGNQATDFYRSINFDYNQINLPRTFTYTKTMGKLSNFYTFNGEKLRKTYENSGTVTKVDYCGPFVYNTASGVRSLNYIITPEGRAVANGGSWEYEYNITDHLGNVRTVIKPGTGGLATVVQEKHYYPFGLEMGYLGGGTSTNKYQYNGKELNNDFEMYFYDYGARFYDPTIGRWHSIDPLAESGSEFSPYAYCFNNPILMNDPTGMWGEFSTFVASSYVDPNGKVIEHRDDGDPRVYLVNDVDKWRKNGSKKEDAEHVGYEYPGVDYANMVGKSALYYPSKAPTMPGFLNDGPLDNSYIIEEVIAALTGAKAAWNIMTLPAKIGDLLKKCTPGRATKGKTEQWERDGNMDQATKDFKSLKPKNVKQADTSKGTLLTGTTNDGKTITVRNFSSDGRPTLEIRNPNNGRGIEIRYNN